MNRIAAIANRIKKEKCIVADIGSDHAFLALEILKNKKVNKIYNIEINQKPLNMSINNTRKYTATNKVINVLNDGLKNWKYEKHFDYVVISGMGSNKIINIISNIDKDIRIDNFIIVSNSELDLLRKFLAENYLYFEYEETIYDRKYYYQLIHVTTNKTKNSLIAKTTNDYYFGIYNLNHKSLLFNKMLEQQLEFIKSNPVAIKYNKNIRHEMRLISDYFKKNI